MDDAVRAVLRRLGLDQSTGGLLHLPLVGELATEKVEVIASDTTLEASSMLAAPALRVLL